MKNSAVFQAGIETVWRVASRRPLGGFNHRSGSARRLGLGGRGSSRAVDVRRVAVRPSTITARLLGAFTYMRHEEVPPNKARLGRKSTDLEISWFYQVLFPSPH